MPGPDRLLFDWVVGHRVGGLDALMWGLTTVGRGGTIWIVLALILAAFRRISLHDWLVLCLAIVMATLIADHLVKPLAGRRRPFVVDPTVAVIGSPPSGESFPSGHAANAFAGAAILARAVPVAAPWYWLLAAAIAYSRMYVGVHYPTDVMAGALVGLLCAALARIVGARIAARA